MNWWKMACVVLVHSNLQVLYMGVSKNSGFSPPKSSILIGFFHYKPSILGALPYSDSLQPHWMSRHQTTRVPRLVRRWRHLTWPQKKTRFEWMGFAEVTGEFSQTTTKNTGKKCPYLLHGTEILMVKINPANKHLGWSWNPVNNEIFTNLNWCRMSSIKSIYLHLDKQFGTCRSKFQVTWSIWDIAKLPIHNISYDTPSFLGGSSPEKIQGCNINFSKPDKHTLPRWQKPFEMSEMGIPMGKTCF